MLCSDITLSRGATYYILVLSKYVSANMPNRQLTFYKFFRQNKNNLINLFTVVPAKSDSDDMFCL